MRSLIANIVVGLSLACLASASSAQSPWKLVWSDEFDGSVGAPPDAAKWKFQTGPGAAIAGNGEAEVYCAPGSAIAPCRADQPNAYLDGKGHLVLVAVKTDLTVTVGEKKVVAPVYTSARMRTVPTFRYGRIEASIRVPTAGKGVWPAFWAMGEESDTIHWPATGEIDIMEQWSPVAGRPDKLDPLTSHSSIHGPKEPGSKIGYLDQTADYRFPGPPSGGLHQFAVEWSPGEVDFFVDGYRFTRQSVATLTGREVWEEDRAPFFLLLNLAMGGEFFGYPDAATSTTPAMIVDYVRVFQRDETALPAGWGSYDVGGPSEAGTARFENGLFQVAGGGFGIAGRFDQFHFAYRPLAGDGEVSARVIDQDAKAAQAKAGVMLRASRGAADPFAMAFLSPDGSVHFRYRSTQGDVPGEVLYRGSANRLKIGRAGDVFTAYVSTDGKSWTSFGNARIGMPHDLLAGLIATSRDNRTPNHARFDFIDITRTDAAYDGEAARLPGPIHAEQFNTGGTGYSYSAEFGDTGPAVAQLPDAPDTSGGRYLTGVKSGRYINYSVVVEKEGDYTITLRAASSGPGGSLHLNLDQKALSKPVSIPDTGGSTSWREIKLPTAHLPAGQHTLALVTDSAGSSGAVGNIDFLVVRPE